MCRYVSLRDTARLLVAAVSPAIFAYLLTRCRARALRTGLTTSSSFGFVTLPIERRALGRVAHDPWALFTPFTLGPTHRACNLILMASRAIFSRRD